MEPSDLKHLAAIVEGSVDAIISKNTEGTILSWNTSACRILGYSAEEILGENILKLIPDHLAIEEMNIIQKVTNGEFVEIYQTSRKRKDGILIPVSISISPVRNSRGEIYAISKILRDMSSYTNINKINKIRIDEINHRLKNTISVILSILRLSYKKNLSADDYHNITTKRIEHLLNSNLFISNQELGSIYIKELIKLFADPFVEGFDFSVKGKNLKLDPHSYFYLGLAIHELLTNSTKYGSIGRAQGKISIIWSIDKTNDDFYLEWKEEGINLHGNMTDNSNSGFGSKILNKLTPMSLGGRAEFKTDSGSLIWRLTAPYSRIVLE